MPPAPARRGRALATLKLVALLGTPLTVVFAVWASGVFVGARLWPQRVLEVESRYFGRKVAPELLEAATAQQKAWEVRTQAAAKESAKREADEAKREADERAASEAAAQAAKLREALATTGATSTAAGDTGGLASSSAAKALPTPPEQASDAKAPPPATATRSSFPTIDAVPTPSDPHLQAAWAQPRAVRIELIVEPEVVASQSGWLLYAQELVDFANRAYTPALGLRFELRGVQATTGGRLAREAQTRAEQLAAIVPAQVDVAVVLSQESYSAAPYLNDTFSGDGHCANVIVAALPGETYPHALTLLHALGRCLGALPLAATADKTVHSWMETPRASAAIALDEANRQRLLERKSRPFAAGSVPRNGAEPSATIVPGASNPASPPSSDAPSPKPSPNPLELRP